MKKSMAAAVFLSALLLAGALSGCASQSEKTGSSAQSAAEGKKEGSASFRTVEEIRNSGVIRIGVFTDKAPFGYIDSKGETQGYDVFYARRIAEDLGVKAEFTSLDPASRVEYVSTGKIDITLANFTVTKERAEQVDFALPYMKVALGVVSPEDKEIKSVEELKGKTLIIAKGTTAETYFEKNHPEVKLQKYDAYADAYNALLDGRGDAFSTDNTEVIAWAKTNPGYVVGIETLGDYDTIAAAVAKGNTELLDFLNEEIRALGKENFFHKDYEETLKPVFGDDTDPDSIVVEGGEAGKN